MKSIEEPPSAMIFALPPVAESQKLSEAPDATWIFALPAVAEPWKVAWELAPSSILELAALALSEKNEALAQKAADRLSELKSDKAKDLEALRGK